MAIPTDSFDETIGRRTLKLDGRVAAVTGSDSGIGRAIAEGFALEGAHVAVTFHTDENGAELTAKQVRAVGRKCLVQQLDVKEEASVAALFQAVQKGLGN